MKFEVGDKVIINIGLGDFNGVIESINYRRYFLYQICTPTGKLIGAHRSNITLLCKYYPNVGLYRRLYPNGIEQKSFYKVKLTN